MGQSAGKTEVVHYTQAPVESPDCVDTDCRPAPLLSTGANTQLRITVNPHLEFGSFIDAIEKRTKHIHDQNENVCTGEAIRSPTTKECPRQHRPCRAGLPGFSSNRYDGALLAVLDDAYRNPGRALTQPDARALVILLEKRCSTPFLLKLLTAISSLAAYRDNLILLKREGVLEALAELLQDFSNIPESSQAMLFLSIANFTVNNDGAELPQRFYDQCLPYLLEEIRHSKTELMYVTGVRCLVGLTSTDSAYDAQKFVPLIPVLLSKLWQSDSPASLETARLLANLSRKPYLAKCIFYAKTSPMKLPFASLLHMSSPPKLLVQVLLLVKNLLKCEWVSIHPGSVGASLTENETEIRYQMEQMITVYEIDSEAGSLAKEVLTTMQLLVT